MSLQRALRFTRKRRDVYADMLAHSREYQDGDRVDLIFVIGDFDLIIEILEGTDDRAENTRRGSETR